jgi:Undecaprenyl-phosphate galactose phosphotransferase WbaP
MTVSSITDERRRFGASANLQKPATSTTAPPLSSPNVTPHGTRTGWPMRATYLAGDVVAIALGIGLAEISVGLLLGAALRSLTLADFKLHGLLAAGLLAVAWMAKTYAAIPPRPVRQFRGWVLGSAATCVAVVAAAWLFEVGSLSRYAVICVATLFTIVLASFGRAVCRITLGSRPWWGTRLIVVGSGGLAAKAFANLEREPQWGLRPIGFVDDSLEGLPDYDASRFVGPLQRLDELAAEFGVDRALVAAHSFDADELAELLSRRSSRIRHWIVLPPLQRFPSLWLEECEAARLPALAITNRLALPWSRVLKRAMDLTLTITLGILALPLIAVIAILVRLNSPGPVFYGSERLGRHGRRFKAWKFRTMYREADAVLNHHLNENPELAAEWQAKTKLRHDPRITWIGRWLRITSLDELPQVWNVLVGEMSLVGPRPILPFEIDKYADRYEHYIKLLPGITGLWQVSGRNNTTYEERVDLDTYYVQNWSLWLDAYILACTVKVVLLSEGAY